MTNRKALFIDIDNTLIRGTSINLLVKYAYQQGLIPLSVVPRAAYWYFLYKMNYIRDFTKIVNKTSCLLEDLMRKMPASEIQSVFKSCFESVIRPLIFPQSSIFLNDFKSKGYEIYFISSTFEPLACLLRDFYGFGQVIATQLEIRDHHYTGAISGNICYGSEKLRQIERVAENDHLNLADSYAFSDHISDIPMLEKVGHPVVVNPQGRLKRIAQQRGWEIRRLTL